MRGPSLLVTMVVRFMAGLTKLQSQDDVQSILAFQEKGGRMLVESLHWLFEAHDPDLIQKCMGGKEWELVLGGTTLDPFGCYVIGYCIANSRQPWSLGLRICSINAECIKMLTVVEREEPLTTSRVLTFMAIISWGTMELLF